MVVVSIDRTTGELLAGPDIVSRGFVYMRQSTELIDLTKDAVRKALKKNSDTKVDSAFVNRKVKEVVGQLLYRETKRRPMILPVVMEV